MGVPGRDSGRRPGHVGRAVAPEEGMGLAGGREQGPCAGLRGEATRQWGEGRVTPEPVLGNTSALVGQLRAGPAWSWVQVMVRIRQPGAA